MHIPATLRLDALWTLHERLPRTLTHDVASRRLAEDEYIKTEIPVYADTPLSVSSVQGHATTARLDFDLDMMGACDNQDGAFVVRVPAFRCMLIRNSTCLTNTDLCMNA
jgi:hypothetical protein